MTELVPSITELGRLVEALSRARGEVAPAAPAEAAPSHAGRPLAAWLGESFPGLPVEGTPWLGGEDFAALVDARRGDLLARRDWLGAQAGRLEAQAEAIEAARGDRLARLAAARREAAAAQAGRLAAEAALRAQLARQTEAEADHAALRRRLEKVAPRGMLGYVDARGRQVSPAALQKAARSLDGLAKRLGAERRRSQEATGALARARQAERQAAADLARAEAELARAEMIFADQGARLAGGRELLRRQGDGLAHRERALRKALALKRLHRRTLELAGSLLAPGVADPPAPVDLPEAFGRQLAAGLAAGRRLQRLGAILARLEKRLAAAAGEVPDLLKEQRRINKEIERLEAELPALIRPFLEERGGRRGPLAGVGARLATRMVELKRLGEEAQACVGRRDALERTLTVGLKRGRALQAAWREAGRNERAALAEAEARLEECRQATGRLAEREHRATASLGPVVALALTLASRELVPALVTVGEGLARLATARRAAEALLGRAGDRLPRPSPVNLAAPPLAQKPLTGALRRLAGRTVALERLEALTAATARWHRLLEGPVVAEYRRPLKEAARRLGMRLTRLAAQRDELAAETRRRGEELAGLAQRLRRREGEAGALREEVARLDGLAASRGEELARERETAAARTLRLRELQRHLAERHLSLAQARRELVNLRTLNADQGRALAEERDQNALKARQVADLRQGLARERREQSRSLEEINRLRELSEGQGRELARREAELVVARADQARLKELAGRLAATEAQSAALADRLEKGQRLTRALREKLLERHRLYRRAAYAVDWLDYWRERALGQEAALERARAELGQARQEHETASAALAQAARERDQAQEELLAEKAARSRQALDLLGGQALSLELAASQGEAGRWAGLARQLSLALALSGEAHQAEASELRAQVEALSAEAAALKAQLGRIAGLLEGHALPESPRPLTAPARGPRRASRLPALPPAMVEAALTGLGRARRRLQGLGRSTLASWALIAALTGGLLLATAGTPSKATRADAPLLAPRPAAGHRVEAPAPAPALALPASGRLLLPQAQNGGLELNLVPLRGGDAPLPYHVQRELRRQAERAGLSPKVLLASARAVYAGRQAVEASVLADLAEAARALAQRHPVIFKELKTRGLTPAAPGLAALAPEAEDAQHLFLDRLYQEYRLLGFAAEESLGALAANERALGELRGAWRPPDSYLGALRPEPALEAMGLEEFLGRTTPYILARLEGFLRSRGASFAGDLGEYARNLAFDMFCAAKKFEVPVTFLLAIAQQETCYANVLGDNNRSASPFQIFEPTRELIISSMAKSGLFPPPRGTKLERHLTLATFMAAFHLRELMTLAYLPPRGHRPAAVDMDQVLLRYNGSPRYGAQVGLRQKQLTEFLKNQG